MRLKKLIIPALAGVLGLVAVQSTSHADSIDLTVSTPFQTVVSPGVYQYTYTANLFGNSALNDATEVQAGDTIKISGLAGLIAGQTTTIYDTVNSGSGVNTADANTPLGTWSDAISGDTVTWTYSGTSYSGIMAGTLNNASWQMSITSTEGNFSLGLPYETTDFNTSNQTTQTTDGTVAGPVAAPAPASLLGGMGLLGLMGIFGIRRRRMMA